MRPVVAYLISGPAHAPYVTASAWSLRQQYDGDACIFAYPESIDLVRQICSDPNLRLQCRQWEPTIRGKNGHGMERVRVVQSLREYDVAAYLDADTLVAGYLDKLFFYGHSAGYCATQFNNWTTNHKPTSGRIAWLQGRENIPQEPVVLALTNPYPSINCGVFSARPESKLLDPWHAATLQVRDLFIADEVTSNILWWYGELEDYTVLSHGQFNASPKFLQPDFRDEDVCIWHFHGDGCVRPNKTQRGFDLWWPVFEHCLKTNVGKMQEWMPDWLKLPRRQANKYLPPLMKERGLCP